MPGEAIRITVIWITVHDACTGIHNNQRWLESLSKLGKLESPILNFLPCIAVQQSDWLCVWSAAGAPLGVSTTRKVSSTLFAFLSATTMLDPHWDGTFNLHICQYFQLAHDMGKTDRSGGQRKCTMRISSDLWTRNCIGSLCIMKCQGLENQWGAKSPNTLLWNVSINQWR